MADQEAPLHPVANNMQNMIQNFIAQENQLVQLFAEEEPNLIAQIQVLGYRFDVARLRDAIVNIENMENLFKTTLEAFKDVGVINEDNWLSMMSSLSKLKSSLTQQVVIYQNNVSRG